jgi:hypothetical protein
MTTNTVRTAFPRDKRVIFFYIKGLLEITYQPVMQVSATLRSFAGRSATETNYLTLLLAAGQKETVQA